MAMISSGDLRCALKTPYRDGTAHIVLRPLNFMARLAAATAARKPGGQGTMRDTTDG